jgi:hypothetical protein
MKYIGIKQAQSFYIKGKEEGQPTYRRLNGLGGFAYNSDLKTAYYHTRAQAFDAIDKFRTVEEDKKVMVFTEMPKNQIDSVRMLERENKGSLGIVALLLFIALLVAGFTYLYDWLNRN